VINGSAKAWVNFNGTGTPAIRASFNVSSITDNGVGTYTVNFTTALVDANYSVVGGVIGNTGSYAYMTSNITAPTTSAVGVVTGRFDQSSGTFQDLSQCNVAVFR
jgi:hypothetical protein